jgi:hypothetical protein
VSINKAKRQEARAHICIVLAIILAFGQACVYVASGMYGTPSDLGAGICVLLVVQLVVAGVGKEELCLASESTESDYRVQLLSSSMSYFRRAMVSDQASRCSLRPISASPSCGRLSPPRPLTLAVAQNSRAPSLPSSTYSSHGPTRRSH